MGFGCAGYSAARTIRALAPGDEIHVFEQTEEAPANPMLTTYLASGRITDQAAHPFGSDLEELAGRWDLHVHSGTTVSRIQAAERTVECADGSRAQFDRILIATGARAFCPPEWFGEEVTFDGRYHNSWLSRHTRDDLKG